MEIGQLIAYAGANVPSNYLECNGQAVDRTEYAALYAAIGNEWGAGDGTTTFNVPDLRGKTLISDGTGSGLTARTLAETGGNEQTQLSILNLPSHNHAAAVINGTGQVSIPVNTVSGGEDESNPGAGVLANTGNDIYASSPTAGAEYSGNALPVSVTSGTVNVGLTGGSQAFSNMQPYAVVKYLICHSVTTSSGNYKRIDEFTSLTDFSSNTWLLALSNSVNYKLSIPNLFYFIKPVDASIVAGTPNTVTLDFKEFEWANYKLTSDSATDFDLVLSNTTNAVNLIFILTLTGTHNIVLPVGSTVPTTLPDGYTWTTGTRTITIAAGTAEVYEFNCLIDGSSYKWSFAEKTQS